MLIHREHKLQGRLGRPRPAALKKPETGFNPDWASRAQAPLVPAGLLAVLSGIGALGVRSGYRFRREQLKNPLTSLKPLAHRILRKTTPGRPLSTFSLRRESPRVCPVNGACVAGVYTVCLPWGPTPMGDTSHTHRIHTRQPRGNHAATTLQTSGPPRGGADRLWEPAPRSSHNAPSPHASTPSKTAENPEGGQKCRWHRHLQICGIKWRLGSD